MNTNPLKSKAYYFTAALLATIAVFPLLTIYLSVVFISDSAMEAMILNPVSGFLLLLILLVVPFALTRFSAKKNNLDRLEYYTIAVLCYVIGYIMLFYGTDKLINKQFVVFYKGLDTKLSDVDSYTLTWYYFGRSNVQVLIMGLLETIPALLLLFRRTRFIGAVTMLPVVANVLVTNVFNRISPFTLFAISLLTIFNLFVIYSYKSEIKELIEKISSTRKLAAGRWRNPIKVMKIIFWSFTIIVLGLKTLSYMRNRDMFLYGNGAYQLTDLRINNKKINLDSIPGNWYKKIYKEKDRRYSAVINGDGDEERADIVFYAQHDSIKIAPVRYTKYDNTEEDSTVLFKGAFQLTGNSLKVAGKQHGNIVEAIYKKLPFKDYNWWW